MNQSSVRVILGSLFAGVLYVFASLALMVVTARTYCHVRPLTLGFAVLGFILTGLVVRSARKQKEGSKAIFVLPAMFFLLGTAIPIWLFATALRVCGAGAGR